MAAVVAPVIAVGAIVACSGQPTPKCKAAGGPFATVYTLVSGTGDCSMLPGDVLYIQSYNGSKSDGTPDYDKASVAIEPSTITGLLGSGPADMNMSDVPYGIGNFSGTQADGDGFCTAPTLSVARLRQDAVPPDPTMCPPIVGSPAVDMQYAFTNVRVYNTALALGTMMSADLTYTTTDPTGATCVAKYHVRGVYPAASCGVAGPTTGDDGGGGQDTGAASDDGGGAEGAAATDDGGGTEASTMSDAGGGVEASTVSEAGGDAGDDGGVTEDAAECDAVSAAAPSGPMVPSQDLCSPVANPDAGLTYGTGINSAFAVVCDPNILMCVPKSEPPSFN
jgi:hypothetical protein